MNDRQFEYIQEVAREKSISAAAKKLVISQPSLSQFVKKIEEEIGTPLFERSNPLRLTYAGECYLKMGEMIKQEERAFQEKISQIRGGEAGRITVGCGFVNSQIIMPVLIRRFSKLHNDVSFSVVEKLEHLLKEAADENIVDAVISTSPIDDYAYRVHVLFEEDYLVAVPAQYAKDINVDGDLIDPYELKDIPFVSNEHSTLIGQVFSEILRKSDIFPRTAAVCTSTEAAYAMTRCGVGISIIPESMYWFNRSADVKYYHLKGNDIKRRVYLYYKKDREDYNLFSSFVQESLKVFKNGNLVDEEI